MSKIKELREKYATISSATFAKFANCDDTSSKKYLEYFLKMWTIKNDSSVHTPKPPTAQALIDVVRKFDSLLPYIENKDIYSKEYINFHFISDVVKNAETTKEEKTFIKEKNIEVLIENDDFIFLVPLTHLGSKKYGKGTKWCTASLDESTFKDYSNGGLLGYLIDKKNITENNLKKVALYLPYSEEPLNSQINIFSATDKKIYENQLIMSTWDSISLFKIFSVFRYTFIRKKFIHESKKEVKKFVDVMSSLNFDKLNQNLRGLELQLDNSYILEIKNKIDSFLKELNKIECNLSDQK